MIQENLNEETKEEVEYKELQDHLDIIKALTDRARNDLITCINTIASRNKEELTVAAKSLAKNLVAIEEYSGNLAKELVTEKIISSSLVNVLDNLSKPKEVNNDDAPEEAPQAKSINIVNPLADETVAINGMNVSVNELSRLAQNADENVVARGDTPSVPQVDDLAFKEEEIAEIINGSEEDKNDTYKKWIEKDTFVHRGNPHILDLSDVTMKGIAYSAHKHREQGDNLPEEKEKVDEIIYGNEEAKETTSDEKVSETPDEVGTLAKETKETDYQKWVAGIKEYLERDKVRTILDRKVYFIAANPIINESIVHEEPDYVNITQYIEVIDAESLKYILIERHAKGVDIKDTILFEVDDQDVVEDHVFGRVNRHRYVGQDNKLTALAKSLINKAPNQHAFYRPYVVSSSGQ